MDVSGVLPWANAYACTALHFEARNAPTRADGLRLLKRMRLIQSGVTPEPICIRIQREDEGIVKGAAATWANKARPSWGAGRARRIRTRASEQCACPSKSQIYFFWSISTNVIPLRPIGRSSRTATSHLGRLYRQACKLPYRKHFRPGEVYVQFPLRL